MRVCVCVGGRSSNPTGSTASASRPMAFSAGGFPPAGKAGRPASSRLLGKRRPSRWPIDCFFGRTAALPAGYPIPQSPASAPQLTVGCQPAAPAANSKTDSDPSAARSRTGAASEAGERAHGSNPCPRSVAPAAGRGRPPAEPGPGRMCASFRSGRSVEPGPSIPIRLGPGHGTRTRTSDPDSDGGVISSFRRDPPRPPPGLRVSATPRRRNVRRPAGVCRADAGCSGRAAARDVVVSMVS